jgi:serine/threonine-protein kinase
MAEVRTAVDTRLERTVAIKLMRPELAVQPVIRARFEAEARMAVRLTHPNVVVVYDSGEADGVPYIVMEHLSGESLADRLRPGPMRQAEVREMGMQVLSALDAAHGVGLLHRDIKPANILVADEGRWKVADFGIAKALEPDNSPGDATATGLVLGTPAYLAPERLFGAPATVATDLYSLGVVLYEALTGRRPFETDRPQAWAGVVATTPVTPIRDLRPDVDTALAVAVERSLAKDPETRFASAADMAVAMTGAMVPLPNETTAMRAQPATSVLPAARAWPTEVVPAAVEARSTRRERGPALGLLAGAAILIIVIVILVVASEHNNNNGTPANGTTTTVAPTSTLSSTTTATTSPSTTVAPTTTPTTSAPATTVPTPTTATPTTTPPVTVIPTTQVAPPTTAATPPTTAATAASTPSSPTTAAPSG